MNREELADLVKNPIYHAAPDNPFLEEDTTRLVAALWPVLAQVYKEGYDDGHLDSAGGFIYSDTREHPYGEVPT